MRIYSYFILRKGSKPKYYLFYIPVLAFLLWSPQILLADIQTLERIAEAEREVNYVGIRLKTFISSRGTRTFEERVIRKSPDIFYGKELSVVGERRQFGGSRGDARRDERHRDNRRSDRGENRRNGRNIEHEDHRWHQVRSLFSEKDIQLIAQNYNLEKSPSTEDIANYEADLLTITPKFAGRLTHRLFFARENGVVLRLETLDAEGVLRAMFVYTRISFEPEIIEHKWEAFQDEIKPEPQRSHSISLADGEKILKTKPIEPGYLPPGFQLQDIYGIKDKERTIHLIYTDGLLGFSIFETTDKHARRSRWQRSKPEMVNGTPVYKHQRGPTYAFNWSSSDIHFFLFGAMPDTELQKVVKSIIHKAKE